MDNKHTVSAYPWPGNVRELTNLVERISLLLRCGTSVEDILSSLRARPDRTVAPPPAPAASALPRGRDRAAILAALQQCNGNATRAAKELGISRSTLYRRLQRDAD